MLLVLITAPATQAQDNERISVDAEYVSFDNERGATHLKEDVRITRGEMEVTADEGFAYRGNNGYERVELFGSPVRWRTVTEEGGETTGRSDQVVYDLLERTVTLIGEAYIEEQRGNYSGQRLIYNLDTEGVRGEGGVRLSIEPEVIDEPDEQTDSETEPNAPESN